MHLDDCGLQIRGKPHWLLRAVDQHGVTLESFASTTDGARWNSTKCDL